MNQQQPNTEEPMEEFTGDSPNEFDAPGETDRERKSVGAPPAAADDDGDPKPGGPPPPPEPGPQDTPMPRPPTP